MFLELHNLAKEYLEGGHRRTVFSHLDLGVTSGERIVLLGRSGSGKSTLLNLISGIDRPSAGEIRVDEARLTTMNESQRTRFRRRHIGFVYQSFNLIPTLTVEENVRLPLELNGRRTAGELKRASDLLERVGLGDRLDSFPDTLSGGEQQRVALARALAHEPALLLADEPTGNLDAETGARMLQLIDELTREERVTLIMVSHGTEALPLADRVLRLEQGRLLEGLPETAR
ncbi:ABC transporter ATP-binding protein [Thiohalomonas denitrificans]|uniref:ABC transporter ATP-binding protein n=1 Tax=Thiohalomonas denitrificans TaxID=415747 RepID=UPI0026EBC38C|nr:ABC transporter ATP-binding protein [Thiohalomonas denitrificans]